MDFVPKSITVWHSLVTAMYDSGWKNMHYAEETNSYADFLRSVLVMFGDVGHGTGFHFDWSRAVNLAMEVLINSTSIASGLAIALWLFIPPTEAALAAMSSYLKDKHRDLYPDGLDPPPLIVKGNLNMRGSKSKTFTANDLYAMAADPVLRDLGIRTLEQKSGEVVLVEPGWMHAVVNLRACVKIAYDFVLQRELGTVALVQHLFHSKVTSQNNADDYVAIGNKLLQEAKTFVYNNS